MNKKILKTVEKAFLEQFPGGFSHPQMVEIGKKHKMGKLTAMAEELFSLEHFETVSMEKMAENMIKMLTGSSMVSVFEKPKFRDFVRSLHEMEKEVLVNGLKEFLHGEEELGFNMMLEILALGKLAKWSVITVWGAYYKPEYHVFCKPTTVKDVIRVFEIENCVYNPKPSYAFYEAYRKVINQMKKEVDPGLSPSNAAFSGFLMMSME